MTTGGGSDAVPAVPGEPALAALSRQFDAAPGSANGSINSSEWPSPSAKPDQAPLSL